MKMKVLSKVVMPIWENGGDRIGLHARRDAERRLRAMRGNNGDFVARAET